MKKGIRVVAAILAGIMISSAVEIKSRANEEIKYTDVPKVTEDGKPKDEMQVLEEIRAATKALPVETNELKNWPKGPEIYGEAGIVMDMGNGAVLYGKSIDKKYYPASITKIMTALLAIENSKMDDVVTISKSAIDCLKPGYAHIALKEGEQITMRDALHALMLASANEAAYAIGETVGGTHENFVNMMNERAKELGCENTNFVNTNGIFDENHYTSARDMALISKEAFSHQELLDVMQTLQYTIQPTNMEKEPRVFQQKHKMMTQGKHFDKRCIGGKTGYTNDSHNTLVTAMEEDGRRLVAVILGSRDETVENTKEICDYGFANFKNVSIAEQETSSKVGDIPEEAYVTLPKDMSFKKLEKKLSDDGELAYYYKDNLVGKTQVTVQKEEAPDSSEAKPEEEEKPVKKKESKIKDIIKTVVIVLIAAVVVFGVLLEILVQRKRRAKRRRREAMRRRQRQMEQRRRREQRR